MAICMFPISRYKQRCRTEDAGNEEATRFAGSIEVTTGSREGAAGRGFKDFVESSLAISEYHSLEDNTEKVLMHFSDANVLLVTLCLVTSKTRNRLAAGILGVIVPAA